jgi:hypothetical protein
VERADDILIPADVLDFFRQLQRLADNAVRSLEKAAANSGGALIERTVDDTLNLHDRVDATVHAPHLALKAQVPSPQVIVTAERVQEAKAFVATLKKAATATGTAGGALWLTAQAIDVLEGLISFAERLVGR